MRRPRVLVGSHEDRLRRFLRDNPTVVRRYRSHITEHLLPTSMLSCRSLNEKRWVETVCSRNQARMVLDYLVNVRRAKAATTCDGYRPDEEDQDAVDEYIATFANDDAFESGSVCSRSEGRLERSTARKQASMARSGMAP